MHAVIRRRRRRLDARRLDARRLDARRLSPLLSMSSPFSFSTTFISHVRSIHPAASLIRNICPSDVSHQGL